MIDKFKNVIEVRDIDNTLETLNQQINTENKMYMHRNYFNDVSIENLISDILIKNNIREKHLIVDDAYMKKHFTGLSVLSVECDNYDFNGKELPPSYYGKIIYKEETVSEE